MVATSDIQIRHLPRRTVAYQQYRGTLPSIESATNRVESWVVTMGYKPEGPMAVEIHGEPTSDLSQEYEMEIQLPVGEHAKAHPQDRVQIKSFEEADAVVMTVRGPCELTNLGESLVRLKEWMQRENLEPGPAVRWVEITDPAKVSPDEQITEIQYLVTRS